MTQHPSAEHSDGEAQPEPDPLAGVTRVVLRNKRKEPYRTIAVVAVGAGLAAVPALALLGRGRLGVWWLAAEILVLALVRAQRPEGTWMAARGRRFDVVFGLLLAAALFALSRYADLPRVL